MRLIDADALKERIGDLHFQNYGMALIAVCEAPTVDAVEVVRGKWLYDSIKSPIFLICNKCGAAYRNFPTDSEYNFCPNCGAKKFSGNRG